MISNLEFSSPFYEVYKTQSEVIDAAIRRAAEESAAKMGERFATVYSLVRSLHEDRKAA